jgi:CelD/BcsL family acetyltransferase involved in cellulose biosynthesis
LTSLAPHAKAVFFGASYHADYATVLAEPEDLPAVAETVVVHLAASPDPADPHPLPWDAVDLRRLRCGDPAADALAAAFGRREIAAGWTVNLEREDVCPVAALPVGGALDDHLATLGKKVRHEIRRKVRRAESAGEVRLDESPDPLADLEAFIDLHQARGGDDGLCPPTAAATRVGSSAASSSCPATTTPARLSFLSAGGRRIAAGIHLDDGESFYYYNAGVDPGARELSPGVVMIARYVERALAHGRRRLDFLRGDEPYKYGFGAVPTDVLRITLERS